MTHVAVLHGGMSDEREVSLSSGMQVDPPRCAKPDSRSPRST